MSTWYDLHIVLIQGTMVSFLLALSVQVQLRTGVFSLAGIGFYAIGTYASAIFTAHVSGNAILALLFGIACACVVGYLLALLTSRLDGLYLAMATVAFDLILTVLATNGGKLTGGATGLYGVISDLNMTEVFAVTLLALVVVALTERGNVGRRIVTTRTDAPLAVSLGINVRWLRTASFLASAALAASAGGVNVLLRMTIVPTDVGFSLVVTILTMIIVGGMRSWLGVLIGAVVFTWLPYLLTIVGEYQAIVYGAFVLIASVFLPDGILGVATALIRKLGDLRRPAPPIEVRDVEPDETDIESERMLLQSSAASISEERP